MYLIWQWHLITEGAKKEYTTKCNTFTELLSTCKLYMKSDIEINDFQLC